MSEDNNTGWAIIPPWILANPELSANEKLIAGRLWGLSGNTGYCWASNTRLGVELGLSPKTVSKIITKLNNKGLIRVELVKNDKKEILQRRCYPAIPLCPNGSIPLLQREHRYAPKRVVEYTLEYKDLDTTTTTKSPPVVVDFENDDIKTPCDKCNDFKGMERVEKAKEIYKAASAKKTIKNPTGYICATCKKGAFLPPDHVTERERGAKAEVEKAAKAAAEAEAREAAEKDARARAEFLNLSDDVKAHYINNIKAALPSNFNFGEAAVCAMAAAKWAQEAKYAE